MKLLIAEDDCTTRTMLTGITEKWGYEPIAVENGEAAWQILQEENNPPLLLLLDWNMPLLNGPQLCQRIRQQETKHFPYIILLTSRNDTKDIVDGLQAGSNDYMSKPFENLELQARLQVGQRILKQQADLNQTREHLATGKNH
ncbi:MAG: response regulator transcription factor [Betaproteobacteria bacterium]|nr:response regulator transcription factor [Betaproteobacteria bacterium]